MRKTIVDRGFETPYRLRKQIVEAVFGQIKQARGFRQFLLRGLAKVRAEWAMTHRRVLRNQGVILRRMGIKFLVALLWPANCSAQLAVEMVAQSLLQEGSGRWSGYTFVTSLWCGPQSG
jgi:hypothetical protein